MTAWQGPSIAEGSGVCYLFGLSKPRIGCRMNLNLAWTSISLIAGVSRKLMSIQSAVRSLFLVVLSLSWACVFSGGRASAQKLKNIDGSLSVFAQTTGSSSGNGVQDNPTKTVGELGSFRQWFHPWMGYEVNYSYSRFSEYYSVLPFQVQNNVHETTAAYLVQGPSFLGIRPFATGGVGALIFLPTTTGGQQYGMQKRLTFLYELGLNYPLLTSHFGVRLQYRGLLYKTPDFGQAALQTNARRQTSEGAVGLYLRF